MNLAKRAWNWLAPSAAREAMRRRALRREHGLHVGYAGEAIELRGTTFGKHCRVTGPVFLADCRVGDYSYFEPGCRVSATDVGPFCSFAPNCLVGSPGHPLEFVSTHPAFFLNDRRFGYDFIAESRDASEGVRTTIGPDVWLGAGAVVRRGVTIGEGAVIGAGAVVVKDVEPYAIVGGIPAKPIRYRFDEATREALSASRWWEQGEAWLRENAERFDRVDWLVRRQTSPPNNLPPQSADTPDSGRQASDPSP